MLQSLQASCMRPCELRKLGSLPRSAWCQNRRPSAPRDTRETKAPRKAPLQLQAFPVDPATRHLVGAGKAGPQRSPRNCRMRPAVKRRGEALLRPRRGRRGLRLLPGRRAQCEIVPIPPPIGPCREGERRGETEPRCCVCAGGCLLRAGLTCRSELRRLREKHQRFPGLLCSPSFRGRGPEPAKASAHQPQSWPGELRSPMPTKGL